MPSEVSRPASAIVIRVTTKMPVGVANQCAPLALPNVAHNGWKSSSLSTVP